MNNDKKRKVKCDNCDKESLWVNRITGTLQGKSITVCSFDCQDEITLKMNKMASKAL